ncbi:phosphatidylglycerophosphatase A family protein [Desulfurobacterium atlanticum]|uniref:Phosphatidylglycerophosphatase A n=1 Tax=Desulfurobacterium atlanticum TaxID=240169 RepID=A0A238Z4K9_9BACT|nr:phosphatidylglycerophosphatase A [Desulfurobacterium atlanticum]SNR77898.1 phosphatidylglycerophosphatase A [Desulfurobacterium atlanticum]
MIDKLWEFIATGCYSGKLPKMPGTWGSIFAAVLIYFFWPDNLLFQGVIVLLTFVLSVLSSHFYSLNLGVKDPDSVVIDEIIGMQIAMLGIKPSLSAVLFALVIFRIIDIMKPPPIKMFEKLPGGFGITVDDMVAGLYTNLLLRLLVWRNYV